MLMPHKANKHFHFITVEVFF